MKFTLSWLKKHLETDAPLEEIVDKMVEIGLEVEEVENPAERLEAITVGHVIAAERHPDADKLQVCRVETKDGEKQIVCGAPNARQGIKVAYAPVGTYIPGIDVTLSKAKIRGVESFGMLCSTKELELGEDHDGIMELPEVAAVGIALADVLGLDDPVIDFEVTPNRPDTNGVNGVARDLAAAGLGTLIDPPPADVAAEGAQPVSITVDAAAGCPVFAARVIRGVKNGPSPQWLQDQLRAIGLRPINALVDVTNYLSYDRARPLHVYDVSQLSGTMAARAGRTGESFEALDGKTYTVEADDCVIADEARVLGFGGIMGGTYSGCTNETTDVLIESAWFDPLTIARTGRKTGIVSDARYRFERGVDPDTVVPGLDRAAAMILELCGGTATEMSVSGEIPTVENNVLFPPAEVERLTGINVPDGEKERILTALGFTVTRGGTWEVGVPSFRPDIEGKADLVEEIARIHGLGALPADPLPVLPLDQATAAPKDAARSTLRDQRVTTARQAATALGFDEAVTWAFCSQEMAEAFSHGDEQPLLLANPIAADLNAMRPSALPNLLLAASRNHARGSRYTRLFEVGGRYRTDTPDGQDTVVSFLASGTRPATWQGGAAEPDVFDAKATALAALETLGIAASSLQTFAQGPDYFHPGRVGSLGLGPKVVLAHFGEIHPRLTRQADLKGRVAAVQLYLDALPPKKGKGRTKAPLVLSSLMPVARDFAFVVSEETEAEKLLRAIRGADKQLIDDVRLFDVYRGDGVADGHKSLAVEVVLQPRDKTLTDEEIEKVSTAIIQKAEKATGATLRG